MQFLSYLFGAVMPLRGYQSDHVLFQYLLGLLQEECERLDEMSIANDEFAVRLRDTENDLVDAYVRGELPRETAEQFRSAYLASPGRRGKVSFAESLFVLDQRRKGPGPEVAKAHSNSSAWNWHRFWTPNLGVQFGLAAAALALLIATGYLAVANRSLREQLQADRVAVSQERSAEQARAQPPSAEPTAPEQKTGPVGGEATSSEKNAVSVSGSSSSDHLKITAFVLAPALRGTTQPPQIVLGSETDLLVLRMELETNDFARFRAVLQDSARNRPVWKSGDLQATAEDGKQFVSVGVRASLLKHQNYVLQLSGISGHEVSELITEYPFRISSR